MSDRPHRLLCLTGLLVQNAAAMLFALGNSKVRTASSVYISITRLTAATFSVLRTQRMELGPTPGPYISQMKKV